MDAPAKPGRRLRVLVVDDQPVVRQVVADTIQYGGHEVVATAGDGAEAVRLAAELHPDVVVMDLIMPGVNGVTAMKTILAAHTAGRVLLMSGEYRSLGVTREELDRLGAAGLLEKPFGVDELLNLLDHWADESPTPSP